MKPYQTRRGIDPNWQKQIRDLVDLSTVAGGDVRLARLLGVPRSTVASWGRAGRISVTGAALVGKCVELTRYFSREGLRPDVDAETWIAVENSEAFKTARALQTTYETNGDTGPIGIIEKRGGDNG